MENEVLNDDELYAKIETEKLLKRKKTKKIATFSALCVAMLLAIVVIIMAAVPVSLKPHCLKSGFERVDLISNGARQEVFLRGEDGFNKFLKEYDKAFGQTYLTALFSGSLATYEIAEDYKAVDNDSINTIKNEAKTSRLVRLQFEENRIFTYQSGKVYKSKWMVDGHLTFNEAYFEVHEDAGLKNINIFIVANNYPVFDEGQQTGTEKRLVVVTVKANTSIIFNAWKNLVD